MWSHLHDFYLNRHLNKQDSIYHMTLELHVFVVKTSINKIVVYVILQTFQSNPNNVQNHLIFLCTCNLKQYEP